MCWKILENTKKKENKKCIAMCWKLFIGYWYSELIMFSILQKIFASGNGNSANYTHTIFKKPQYTKNTFLKNSPGLKTI
jgi:hypothetical protein